MLGQHEDLYLVLFSLLSTFIFGAYYKRGSNSAEGLPHPFTVQLGMIISFLIWIGVIYLEFYHLKWWLAILDLILIAVICAIAGGFAAALLNNTYKYIICIGLLVVSLILLFLKIF